MKTVNNLSVRKTLSVTRNFRKFGVRFETNLKGKLSAYSRQLEDFFEIKTLGDVGGSENVRDVPIVHCVNVEGLIRKVQEVRQSSGEESMIKFGIDGGGGFFKITLSLIASPQQSSKSDGFRDGGVRRSVFFYL